MPGVVIRLSPRAFGETRAEGDMVSAGAAALDKRVAETAAAANIGGMEFLFGIPGTIGGALRMNAGANGSETRDVLIEATGIGRDGTKHAFSNADMKFVYRNSGVDPCDHFYLARGFAAPSPRRRPSARGWTRCRPIARPRSRSAKDRRLDLQEPARRQRLEADRRRRLPRLARRRRAGVGNALQFPDQYRQRRPAMIL